MLAAVTDPLAVTVATLVVCEVHATEPVKFCVELSEKVPVAVNCSELPLAIERFGAVTAIDTNVAALTVRVADPWMFPEEA
jgi:hypothetical protein